MRTTDTTHIEHTQPSEATALLPDGPLSAGKSFLVPTGIEQLDGESHARLDVVTDGKTHGHVLLRPVEDEDGVRAVEVRGDLSRFANPASAAAVAAAVDGYLATTETDVVRVPWDAGRSVKIAFARAGHELANKRGEIQAMLEGFHPTVTIPRIEVRRLTPGDTSEVTMADMERVLASIPASDIVNWTASDGVGEYPAGEDIVANGWLERDLRSMGSPIPEGADPALRDVAKYVATGAAALTLVAAVPTFFASKYTVDAGHIAVVYEGGPFDGRAYQSTVDGPTGLQFHGVLDQVFYYPSTQRNYIVSLNPSEGDRSEADAITAPSSDRQEIRYEVTITYRLNPELIREFHEELGLKYHAYTEGNAEPGDGWDDLLNDYMRKPLERALQQQSRTVTAEELYRDPEVLRRIEQAVEDSLQSEVSRLSGDEYFCGPAVEGNDAECGPFQVIVQRAIVPEALRQEWEKQEASEAAIVTATNEGDAAEARAEAEANVAEEIAKGQQRAQEALNEIYSDPAYIEYLRAKAMEACASNPGCVLVVTDGGGASGVNVNVPAGGE